MASERDLAFANGGLAATGTGPRVLSSSITATSSKSTSMSDILKMSSMAWIHTDDGVDTRRFVLQSVARGPNSASKRALTFACFPSRFTMGPFGGALPELADVVRWEGQVIYGIGVWGAVEVVLCGESRVLGLVIIEKR